jgi:hypothetical protein
LSQTPALVRLKPLAFTDTPPAENVMILPAVPEVAVLSVMPTVAGTQAEAHPVSSFEILKASLPFVSEAKAVHHPAG